jgi:hypothetical protein
VAAVHNVTVDKLKRKYCIVSVFISKLQPDQVLKLNISVVCGYRWKWINYSATANCRLIDKSCYVPLRYGHE